ncbi:MAG TPA: GNAT family protein [Pseudonocardia sp.]|nr:GNAT family protein [Pseudonocardia sp.]
MGTDTAGTDTAGTNGTDSYPDPWPLRGLVVRTPRLELRPDDDAGLAELVAVAYRGVHPPEQMPFVQPWTDADPRYLGRGTLQYHWRNRATLGPESWMVAFLVRLDGRVVGSQHLSGVDFAVTREVSTGSWLGMAHQGRGLGTEMRAAVLGLAFDHLGAELARSGAFADNPASLAVSRRLGYRADGSHTLAVRGRPKRETRLLLTRDDFQAHRPAWVPRVSGVDACRALLGAG